MGGRIEARLKELGIQLPPSAGPVANYVPFVFSGNLLFISGQLPMNGQTVMVQGILGAALGIPDGQKAARQCALNILAQAATALDGDLDRITRIVKLGVFVACTPAFFSQAQVANGASDFLVDVLGEAGRHARAAVGVPALPREAAVEIEAIVEVSL
jgi:enamine deaminase RidA (YjgF/YER057c/UK114 family)